MSITHGRGFESELIAAALAAQAQYPPTDVGLNRI